MAFNAIPGFSLPSGAQLRPRAQARDGPAELGDGPAELSFLVGGLLCLVTDALVELVLEVASAAPGDEDKIAVLCAELDEYYGDMAEGTPTERAQAVRDVLFGVPPLAYSLLAWDGPNLDGGVLVPVGGVDHRRRQPRGDGVLRGDRRQAAGVQGVLPRSCGPGIVTGTRANGFSAPP
jgi:hypothetical protein